MTTKKFRKCYFGCSTDDVLHRFPNPDKNEEKFNLWIGVLDPVTQKKGKSYIYNNLRLCDKHFQPFYRTQYKQFTRNAVPTLNICYPVLHEPLLNIEMVLDQFMKPTSNEENLVCYEMDKPLLQNEDLADIEVPFNTKEISMSIDVPSTSKSWPRLTYTSLSVAEPSLSQREFSHTEENPAHISMANIISSNKSKKEAKITSINRQLQKKINRIQYNLKKMSEKYKSQTKKIKQAQNLSKSKIFLEYIEALPKPVQIFNKMQLKFKYKPRGRRFTTEEKVMALSIFKQSPKAYKFLKNMFVLPSKRCLQKQLSLIDIEAGINSQIFTHLKKSVKRLSNEKKLCSLIFDEVALEAGLYFDRKKIVGFEDFGYNKTNQIADHALLFMLKSVKGKFKQPVCYTFCKNSTKKEVLKNLLTNIIREVHKTGLTVIATICDQSQTNVSVVNSLKEDTKASYLRQGLEYNNCIFEIDHKPIFHIFDTPHLLKGVRNNLLKKDAKYFENGMEKIASWKHIIMLYNEDVGEQELKLVNKLTEFHVFEHKIPKMKVKHAAQIFSQRVASALNFLAKRSLLPPECEQTANFLLMFDKLFDSFNGHTYSSSAKEFLGCLKQSSPHVKFWQKIYLTLKNMQFKKVTRGKDGTETVKYEKVPSTSNWANNIKTFIEMWEYLKKEYQVTSLLTRNFNQDPLENFFCSIRSNGVMNTNPSCIHFVNAYKTLLVNNLNSPHSVNANCEADDNRCFQSLSNLLSLKKDHSQARENISFNIDNFIMQLTNQSVSDEQNIIHNEAKRYVAGYIVNKCQRKVFKSCETCKADFFNNYIDSASFIYFRDYTKKSLIYATENFVLLTKQIYDIIILCLKETPHEENLTEKMKYLINIEIDFNIFSCEIHRAELEKNVIEISINIIVHSWCKGVNKLLKGKQSNFDQTDCVKMQAREYFLKKRKR